MCVYIHYTIRPCTGSCGGIYPIRAHGAISSPFLTNGYASWLSCRWVFEAEHGQEIELHFEESNLEEDYDTLVVCDGPVCHSRNILIQVTGGCGVTVCLYACVFTLVSIGNLASNLTVRSSGPFLSLMFSTDGTVFDSRFSGSFTKLYAGTPLKGMSRRCNRLSVVSWL